MNMIEKLQSVLNSPSDDFVDKLVEFIENAIENLREEGYSEEVIEQAVENFMMDALLQEFERINK